MRATEHNMPLLRASRALIDAQRQTNIAIESLHRLVTTLVVSMQATGRKVDQTVQLFELYRKLNQRLQAQEKEIGQLKTTVATLTQRLDELERDKTADEYYTESFNAM